MHKLKYLIIAFLGSTFNQVSAQECSANYLGTKTLYKAPVSAKLNAPNGYHAVFINHLNRHGARHLTKDVNTSFSWGFLKRADSLGMLTPNGQRLWMMEKNLNKVEKGNVKNISAEGKDELFGLGERLYDNYLEALTKPIRLNVAITKEVRTKQSADAYLKGLKSKLKDSLTVTERTDDTNLRFYDLSPTYTKFENDGAWLLPYDSLKRELKIDELQQRIAAKWLKPALLQDMKIAQVDKLISDVFGFENITYSVKAEAEAVGIKTSEIDFAALFTCDELNARGKIDAADGYYKKGPGLDNNGIQVNIAAPLLADFVKSTDAFISSPKYNAELRFAHAETVSPLAAIMDIENAAKQAKNAADIVHVWKPEDIIPLSANIDWILYKNAAGNYLVKFLLNEKPVKITGIKAVTGYYYSWADARKYYMKKLLTLGVALNGNMNEYLSGVK